MPTRPNIMLIFPDQWRGDCLGAMGHPVVDTPFLDDLAGRGVTFTRAYTQCPSCIATRASLATGRTPNSTGRIGYRDGVPWRYEGTLMHRLRDSGYQTLCVGKTHFFPQRLHLGFEEMRLYDVQRHDPHYVSDYHAWLARETGGRVRDTAHEVTSNSWMTRPWEHEEYLHPNSWTIESAIELMSRRDPTRPFFIQVSPHRPHPPIDPPVEYFRQYEGRELPPAPVGDWAARHSGPLTEIDAKTGTLPSHRLDRTRRGYYAQVTHLDYQIGRMLHWMRRRGCLDNTWVIFISDHGELLGDHNHFRKIVPLEGSAHVPLLILPPRGWEGERGATVDAPVAHMDIMPTVLEWAGLGLPDDVEGLSLNAAMLGGALPREWLHGEHAAGVEQAHQYMTDGREKYIWFTYSGEELLFDLASDPQELRDLSGDPAYADRLALWRGRLARVLAERGDDALSDGERLIPGTGLPAVRDWLLPSEGPVA